MDLYNMNISIDAIRKHYTQNKSNSTCSLVWGAANMEAIMAIAKEHNLYVIEDNAQAIGANCKFLLESKRKGR
jgi:dTDP-4-amino-4,6-dideoxygalactose transaminase